jgi:hypothetical protein
MAGKGMILLLFTEIWSKIVKKRNYSILTSGNADPDIVENDDGSVEFKKVGFSAKIEEKGKIAVNFEEPINAISIENILDLLSHTISRSEAAISHDIQFSDGGSVHISYRPDGKLLKFASTRAEITIDYKEGTVTLAKYKEEPLPALMTMPALGSG